MDPSYNNSFGSFNSGQDIVLSGGVEPKKSKRGLITGIIIFLVISIVGIIIGVVFLFGNGTDRAEIAEENGVIFYDLLDDNKDDIYGLLVLTGSAADGVFSLSDFLISDEEYGLKVESISNGIESLKLINERIRSNGFFLEGIEDMIDLEENYRELTMALDRDLSKYEKMADLTIAIFSVFQQRGASFALPDELVEFDLPELTSAVNNFYKNGSSLSQTERIVQEAYLKVGNGAIFGGEGSILACLNNLYVGTGVYAQE